MIHPVMTPLRQRMLDDMTIRNLTAGTRRIYVRSVANFSLFHGRLPTVAIGKWLAAGSIAGCAFWLGASAVYKLKLRHCRPRPAPG